MKQIKFDIKLVALIFVTVFLVGAIFVVFNSLMQEEKGRDFVPVATTQTKAAPVTYSKDVVLLPTTVPAPTAETSAPSLASSPTPVLVAKIEPSLSVEITPTPTETIIAKVSVTPSPIQEATQSSELTAVPTKTAVLPSAGSIQFPVLIFASAFLLIIFAFLF